MGWEFLHVGVPDPVFMANLRWLARYRHLRCGREAAVAGRLAEVFRQPRRLRVRWQQNPAAAHHLPSELCDAQQAAMNQALRTILSAHRFQIADGPLGEAPLVLGFTRPDG